MDDLTDLSKLIDGAIIKSRLNMFGVMMMADPAARHAAIANTLAALPSGAYLIGTGPSTVGIVPLTVDEVVIGRSATPVEKPAEQLPTTRSRTRSILGPTKCPGRMRKLFDGAGLQSHRATGSLT